MRFERNEEKIRKDIEACITRSLNAAFNECSPRDPQEPDFIAALVDNIPMDIWNSLRIYAPSYQFAVSGIFCHQKPLADFGKEINPEIGDILIIYVEENKYGIKKCNAVLMQAKMCNKTPYMVPSSENHQLRLYEEWPKFKLRRAGKYNGKIIDIQPKSLNPGAQYLLLQSPYKYGKNVCCAYPDKELVPEKKLSNQIIDLMKFFTGQTFNFDYDASDYWSKLIVSLLKISASSHYNRRNSGRENNDRQYIYGDESLFDENFYLDDANVKNVTNDCLDDKESFSSLIIIAKEKSKTKQ